MIYHGCAPMEEYPGTRAPSRQIGFPPRQETPRATAEWAYQQGLYALDRGNFQEAIQYFQLVVERDSQHIRAYLSLADVYNMQDNFLLAETYYNKVLNIDPQSVPALSALGAMQWKMGNLRDASSFYKKVLEINPHNQFILQQLDTLTQELFDLYYEQGVAYKEAGELTLAATAWQKALSLYPDDVDFMVEIGNIFLNQQDYTMADGYFQQALTKQPEDILALIGAGRVQLALGHHDEAIHYFQDGLARHPGNSEAARLLQRAQSEKVRAFLPQEYFAIDNVEQVSRGDVAALLVVDLMLESRLAPSSRLAIISDITTHWAKPYIIKAVQYGIMQIFTDRSFLPYDPIKKGRLAFVLDNLCRILGVSLPEGGTVSFTDVHPENMYYSAIRRMYAAGVMVGIDENTFGIDTTLSGEDVTQIFTKIKQLLR